ncbi:MAG: hypothetical protein OXU45_04715, partial [Candidatus Melainabacteria bacterium]|nr:hypothetical protein [Candidatus Melainabacteria bacterium]
MERNIDPRSNPIVGSEVISGQITDKALALFNLLNQVTGSEGDNVKNFEIEGADPLTLALYTLEADESSHAWSPRERIYFQDNGQKLRNLQAKLRTNFDRIESDITGNINTLFKLISLSENNNTDIDGDGVIDKGVVVGDANKSILEEISAIANDSEKTNEDLENAIEELVTGETAINRLVDALFANFNLNVQRLDDEIFDLLDDGDDVFSSDNTGTDSTETTKYFLDFGDDSPAYIASSLEDAADRTLAFLESQHDGDEPWNRDTAVSNYSLGKFFNGRLLLDQGLIDAIIADDKYFSQDPDIQKEELKEIRNQRDFLTK